MNTSIRRFTPALPLLGALAILSPSLAAQLTVNAQRIECIPSLRDQAGGDCIEASSDPTLGMLFPISNELFVDMNSGFVGMGTVFPDESLQIGEYFQTSRDNYIEMRTIGGAGSEFKQGMKLRSSNPFFGFNIEHDDFLKGLNMLRFDDDFGTTLGASTLFLDRETGNVGFGTTAPAQNLHVMSDRAAILRLEADTDNFNELDNARIELIQDGGLESGVLGFRAGSNDLAVIATGDTNSLVMGANDTEHIRVVQSGRVGIGTTNPQGGLSVTTIGSSLAPLPGVHLGREGSGTSVAIELVAATTGNPHIDFTTGASTDFDARIIYEEGSGRMRVQGTDFRVDGNICATGSIGSCSDERYKKDVMPLEQALDTIAALRGVSYRWKTDEFPEREFTDEPQIGFLAQEVLAELPEVVAQDAEGYYSVDYGRLTPVLVEAIKELSVKNSALEARVASLESMQAELAEVRAAVALVTTPR